MKIITAFIILIMATSCRHNYVPVTYLEPGNGDFIIENGAQVIEDSSRGCKIRLKYLETGPNEYYFNIKIINCTDTIVKFEPSDFHYVVLEKTKNYRVKRGDTVYAVDPKQIFKELDIAKDKENSSFCSSMCCLGTGLLVGALLSSKDNKAANSISESMVSGMVDNTFDHAYAISSLNNRKDYLKEHLLIKKEVLPRDSVQGDILFPMFRPVAEMTVNIPISKANFHYDYVQMVKLVEK